MISRLLLLANLALAASAAFMMPVATPPNAIIYGSGHVAIGVMARVGFVVNLCAIVAIVVTHFPQTEVVVAGLVNINRRTI